MLFRSKGSLVAARKGSWSTGAPGAAQSAEDWTLWVSKSTAEAERSALAECLSSIAFSKDGVRSDPDARAIAERIQDLVEAPVVAGLHTIAAANLEESAPQEDALICGDDVDAKALAIEISSRIVAGSALDAGPLASARTLEGLTAVIVNMNKRYKAHAGIRITGVHHE